MIGNIGILGKIVCVLFVVLIMVLRMCCLLILILCVEKFFIKIKKDGEKSNGYFGDYLKLYLLLIDCNKV